MSHYTPMHARDGQRRDAIRARARDTWTRIRKLATLEFHLEFWLSPWGPDWWDWEWVQAHWYRQFKRADRKAFAAECEEIRARALMTPAPELRPVQAPRPADPPGATSARCGPGQPPAPGAVAAGTGTDAGVPPAPVTAAADAVPPSAGAAAPLPRPHPSQPPWPGQPDHLWPGGPVTAPAGSRRSNEQQFARAPQHPMPAYRGDYRPTAPFRAVSDLPPVNIFRPHYERHEARRDSVARWGA